MISQTIRLASVAALVAFSLPVFNASAQQEVPAAPAVEPTAPAPAPAVLDFPKPDPANFTASSPTKEQVNAFLQVTWGFDKDRVWQVQAILKTPAEGVSRVLVLVKEKIGTQKPSALEFFVLPDGKHVLANNEVTTFGDHPFAEARAQLQQSANGPYRGAASKDLELVEFVDFGNPRCKEAQANMDKLAVDFPKARIVFQLYPVARNPISMTAASYGACVAKQAGSDAFLTFASAVFEGQAGLATADGATLTLNSATAKAGLAPVKIAACAASPETKAAMESSIKMAEDVSVNQTPVLMVNGRKVFIGGLPYDMLKKVVLYQAKLDGVTQ